MKQKINFAVQASSRGWAGGKDLCMNLIEGKTVLENTVNNILSFSGFDPLITIISPDFDKNFDEGGGLNGLFVNEVKVFYGFNDSPLDRMLGAFSHLDDNDYLVRIDGLHFAINLNDLVTMYSFAKDNKFDCVKFPDDFPIHFTFDIYKIGALRLMKQLLSSNDDIFKVHPKYFMISHPEIFNFKYFSNPTIFNDIKLNKLRANYHDVFQERQGSIANRIKSGDQLNFHYEIAAKYILNKGFHCLDLASGEGYGSVILSEFSNYVIGGDYSIEVIQKARELHRQNKKLFFQVEDATNTSFLNNQFDLIASMETLEHVNNENLYMVEMKRILKSDGVLIISTPQNSLGHIPMNNNHFKEYSLQQLVELCEKYFQIEKIYGIKQGRVILENNNLGTNTLIILRNK